MTSPLGSLPSEIVRTGADVIEAHRRDEASVLDAGIPMAVVFPRTTGEVQQVIRVAAQGAIPIVPRGAGSGLSGGANAIDGCIVLSLARMDRVIDIDTRNLMARVQPGVITGNLDRRCRSLGLSYPPDPSSRDFCTIGGNVATNAGGLCCVKYGVTGEYVLGLEVVLADGTAVRLGRRTRKGVAGYDLTRLFVGSEGTLGVVTEVTLRLRPAPPPASTLVAEFPKLDAAGNAISRISTNIVPSLLELMDRTTIRAVETMKPLGLDEKAAALLVIQSDAGDRGAELDQAEQACTRSGAISIVRSSDPSEAEYLLEARRAAFFALGRGGETMLDDVAVPPAEIPALLTTIEQIAQRNEVTIGTFGHAGDGNMHPTIVFEGDTERGRALAAFDEIVHAALGLGGTATGEHGTGILKSRFLPDEMSAEALGLHQALKDVLDPNGIMNPGKIL
ncbi:MAG: FAD-binding oxidoreductase [Actinomycetota bacterium]